MALIMIFTIMPLMYSFYLSLQGGRGSQLQFVGTENYQRLLSDQTIAKSFLNTILFAIVLVPIVVSLGVLLANAINKVDSDKLKGLFSVVLFFPSITSPVAYAYLFRHFFAVNGFLNNILLRFNVITEANNYLLTATGARIAIIIVCIWAWTGYYTMLILSAMQNINPLLYKAAKIDGASDFQVLTKVSLPLLKPIILLSSVMLSGGIFQLFTEVFIISRGGPEETTLTLAYYIYRLCFEYASQFGYAASIGIIIFLISSIAGFIQLKLGEMEHE